MNAEEIDSLNQEIQRAKDSGEFIAASQWVRTKGWKSMWEMCCDIGWSQHFDTMYRSTSEIAHSGSYRLGKELSGLHKQEAMPEWQLTMVMVTALSYYSDVVRIAAEVFPDIKANFESLENWGDQMSEMKASIQEQAKEHVYCGEV